MEENDRRRGVENNRGGTKDYGSSRERIRNRVLCIYIYMRVFVLIPLASFKCKNSKGKRIFSLAIERGIDLFSCATSGNGKEAFSRGGTEIQPSLWKAEDTPLIFQHGILLLRSVHRGGEYLPRFFRFEFIADRYGNLEFEIWTGMNLESYDVNAFARSGKIYDKVEGKLS